ncbi:uncharacterized protein LOC112049010 [Bicyclus anynana]|uniref:Uncharacterized protein LOC112049010 n=1 Tax=Bicyclus anynana TaxID=110368 RepID=A0A6J1NHC8_BICAN|nr:uncharacterized protein LOC112049010 [Bicyclus anynana]
MKGALVCFLAVVALAAASKDQYPDRYDNIDVDEIINNDRLFIAYIKCCLETGKCTPEGRELRSHIKDALENQCKKCTEIQRGWTRKVMSHLINNKPEYWKQLVDKYDAQRKFTVKYEKELRAIKGEASNMKTIVCLFALVAVCLAKPELYTDRYDNIDLDEILSNRRLLVPYIKCILDQGKCSPEGKELKLHIVDALENNCDNCTEAQKKGTKKVIGHLINKEKDFWAQLCAKYDPENKYAAKYEKELKEVAA